jgi:hypothetical protein
MGKGNFPWEDKKAWKQPKSTKPRESKDKS